jgi:hypothetical protein
MLVNVPNAPSGLRTATARGAAAPQPLHKEQIRSAIQNLSQVSMHTHARANLQIKLPVVHTLTGVTLVTVVGLE